HAAIPGEWCAVADIDEAHAVDRSRQEHPVETGVFTYSARIVVDEIEIEFTVLEECAGMIHTEDVIDLAIRLGAEIRGRKGDHRDRLPVPGLPILRARQIDLVAKTSPLRLSEVHPVGAFGIDHRRVS